MMHEAIMSELVGCDAGDDCPLCAMRLRRGTWGIRSSDPAAWIWPGETRVEDEFITAEEEHEVSEWKDGYFPLVQIFKKTIAGGPLGESVLDTWNVIEHPVLGRWDHARAVYYLPTPDPAPAWVHEGADRARALARDARVRVLADLYLVERLEPRDPEPESMQDIMVRGMLQGLAAETGRYVFRRLGGVLFTE